MFAMNAEAKQTRDRLLIVAADAGFRDAAAAIAEKLGFELFSTGYAENIRRVVRDLRPNVIILDAELFGSQRMGVLAFLAREESPPRILLLSGTEERAGTTVMELAAPLQLDIVEVLTPPVDYAELEDTLRALQRSTRIHALQRNND